MNTNYFQDQPKAGFEGRGEVGEVEAGKASTQDGGELAARVPVAARQLLDQARKLPKIIDSELRENPYRLLGIVGAAGVGIGMLIGSRVMRTIVLSVGGYAISETLRAYVNDSIQKFGSEHERH